MSDELIAFLRAKAQALIELGTALSQQGVDAADVVEIGVDLANRAMELERPGFVAAVRGAVSKAKPN
jgi:hypothetical protein